VTIHDVAIGTNNEGSIFWHGASLHNIVAADARATITILMLVQRTIPAARQLLGVDLSVWLTRHGT
jgi:hypothetical protein